MRFKPIALVSTMMAAGALTLCPMLWAQTASEWGHAAVDTGKDAVHSTARAFHKVADDPILTERTKSALAHDPVTRNQPIVVSAENGIVILRGTVAQPVANRAVQIARQVEGSRGVENKMMY